MENTRFLPRTDHPDRVDHRRRKCNAWGDRSLAGSEEIDVFRNVIPGGKRRLLNRAGYTLIELLAVMFIVALATVAYATITRSHGIGMGIVAALIGGSLGFGIVALFYRRLWERDKAQLGKLRANYGGIYRVLTVPHDNQPEIMLEGAEIRTGDYGWEAAPLANEKDGLVYLQGLTPDWRTVWHAGFHPNEIERICLKPSSQYDHWVPYWAKAPPDPCPFPIQPRETPSMERPHHSRRYFQAYPQPQTGKMVKVKNPLIESRNLI